MCKRALTCLVQIGYIHLRRLSLSCTFSNWLPTYFPLDAAKISRLSETIESLIYFTPFYKHIYGVISEKLLSKSLPLIIGILFVWLFIIKSAKLCDFCGSFIISNHMMYKGSNSKVSILRQIIASICANLIDLESRSFTNEYQDILARLKT